MTDLVEAIKPLVKHPSENNVGFGINGKAWLKSGQTFGAVSGVDVSPTGATGDMTISGATVNTVAFLDDDGEQVSAGKGITFSASAGLRGRDYRATFHVTVVGGYSGETRAPVCVMQIRDGKP